MIAPDALLKADAADIGRDGASLGPIEPAVGAPRERVGKGVCVFHAEAGEQNPGRPVGTIVAVAIGVEQEVRRLRDEHAAISQRHPGREIEVGDEILDDIGAAVAVGVFIDRDPVLPLGPVWAVVRDSRSYLVRRYWSTATGLSPTGCGYWRYCKHPHPTAVVEADRQRLRDHAARRRPV